MSPGQTLCLRGGTYAQSITGVSNSGNSWAEAKTIRSYPGEVATITGGAYLGGISARYLIFDSLVFNGSSFADGIKITTSSSTSQAATIDQAAHHIRVINSEIKNIGGQGFFMSDMAGSNEFINNKIHDGGGSAVGPCYDHGFYIGSSDNLIEGNEIYNWSGYGITIYNGYEEYGWSHETANRNIMRNNYIHDNGRTCTGTVAGIGISSGDDNEAYNNIITNTSRATGGTGIGIQIDGCYGVDCGYRARVYNNTVYNNTGVGIYDQPEAFKSDVRNNIIYNNSQGGLITNNGTYSNNLIGTNPQFVSAGSNYRLSGSSPAINAGTTISTVTTDFEGTPRPQGGAYDIGADEY